MQFKRAMDLVLTIPMLLLAVPLMAFCAVAIRLTMGAPTRFRQERIGFNERRFVTRTLRIVQGYNIPNVSEKSPASS